MKKIAISLLALVLMLTLVCGTAFATSGDLTMKATRAYSDRDMTKYIGTIPQYTSVIVRAIGTYADIYVNDVECYVNPSDLTCGNYDYNYLGFGTLKANAKVFQCPNVNSKCVTNMSDRTVLVYAINSGIALVRTDYNGIFGFVSIKKLSNLRAY